MRRSEPLPPLTERLPPRRAVADLCALLGEAECVQVCTTLLAGADPDAYRSELTYLGGAGGAVVPDRGWKLYWTRVWGARGLLYVWAPVAEPAVLSGLGDDHWRVAEMCLKVSALRELAAAGEQAGRLAGHALPRVRAQAARTLGVVGDTEHVDVVRDAVGDEETVVRRAAELALARMRERLDLGG